MKKYCNKLALIFKMRAAVASILCLLTGSIYAAELSVAFDQEFSASSLSDYAPTQSSDSQCVQPLAWTLGDTKRPKLLIAIGKDFKSGPASDIRSTLIWQTYSTDGKSTNDVLANVVGSGIRTGYATSINGQSVALIVDYASRASLIKSSGSKVPTEIKSSEGKKIADGSRAKILATQNAVWMISQQGSGIVLDKYDENLKLLSSTKVRLALPSSTMLMDVVARDADHFVLATHELNQNVALARVQLITVETSTGNVIHPSSVSGFNPTLSIHNNEVFFSRVVVEMQSDKPTSEIWIGMLSADGDKVTDWRSHKQERGTLFSTLAITDDKVNLIGARGFQLLIKSFSKNGSPLGEYQEASKFQSPLFGYPVTTIGSQLMIAQAYGGYSGYSTCGSLRVAGFK